MSHTNDNKTETRSGPIAEALIGVWRLREYSDVTEGTVAHYPFGEDPDGLLIYTPDGFVSALLMARGRPNLSGNGFREGTPDEYTSAGKSFIGYTGHYDVDEANLVLTHRPTVAFVPNMIGSVQQRLVDLRGDILVLTAEHVQAAGVSATKSRLKWVRVKAASERGSDD
jgi:Lipocalin-like domain